MFDPRAPGAQTTATISGNASNVSNPGQSLFATSLDGSSGTLIRGHTVAPSNLLATHAGWLGPLADMLTGASALAERPDAFMPTSSLRLDVTPGDVGILTRVSGEGRVLISTPESRVSQAVMHSPDGAVVASAVGRFTSTRVVGGPRPAPIHPPPLTGHDLPLLGALGIEVSHAASGVTVGSLTSNPAHANSVGVMHGGVQLAAADALMVECLRHHVESAQPRLLDATIDFVSAVLAPHVYLRVAIRRAGRRQATLNLELTDTAERLLSLVTATYLLQPHAHAGAPVV